MDRGVVVLMWEEVVKTKGNDGEKCGDDQGGRLWI